MVTLTFVCECTIEDWISQYSRISRSVLWAVRRDDNRRSGRRMFT